MASPQDASAYIHLGLWTNQDKGSFRGLTLTVSPASATLLTNLMALFVTMAGGQFWTILRFTLHQIRAMSHDKARDPEYNRQQVVLRNTTSATSTVQFLVYLGWKSRKDTSALPRLLSSLPIIMLAIFSTVFFILAGVFSNTLIDAGSEVLSRSPFCGFYNQTYFNDVVTGSTPVTTQIEAQLAEYHARGFSDLQRSQQYAQECYQLEGTGSSNCDTFKKSTLPLTTLHNGSCPFDPRICLEGVDTIVFDSGPIDTHKDLGINAVPEDRLTYRKVVHCTVLNDTSYTTGWMNKSGPLPTQPTWRIANASYGQSTFTGNNETYSYSNYADFYTAYAAEYSLSYTVGSDQNYATFGAQDSASTFIPIPELEQKEADLFLFYLSYIGNYLEPVDDPWFAAHQPFSFRVSPTNVVTTYVRDKPITTIGCTEQYQICTAPGSCTRLLGYDQVQQSISANLSLTPKQNVTLNQLLWSAVSADIFQIVNGLAASTTPLLATQKRQNGYHTTSVQLPSDQWKLELANWMSICMAHLQRVTVESETGQIAAQPRYLVPPATDSEEWICQNLMIRSDTYQSFSVLALSMMVFVGTVVLVLSFVIEPMVAWMLRRSGRGETGNEIWRAHDMLGPQLWSSRLEAVKVDGAQPRHPRNDSLASWDTSSYTVDEKGRKRVSSQALSFEDHERFLITKAYEAWI